MTDIGRYRQERVKRVTEFVCKEIWQKNNNILPYCKKKKVIKLSCLQEEQKGEYMMIFVLYSFQRTTKVSCYKYLHQEKK